MVMVGRGGSIWYWEKGRIREEEVSADEKPGTFS